MSNIKVGDRVNVLEEVDLTGTVSRIYGNKFELQEYPQWAFHLEDEEDNKGGHIYAYNQVLASAPEPKLDTELEDIWNWVEVNQTTLRSVLHSATLIDTVGIDDIWLHHNTGDIVTGNLPPDYARLRYRAGEVVA